MQTYEILRIRGVSNRSVRKFAIISVVGIMSLLLFAGTVSHVAAVVARFPTGSSSWNQNVPCNSPWIVKTTDITNNMTGTNSYSSSPFSPGITENPPVSGSEGAKRWLTSGHTPPGWVAPGPGCTITNSRGQVIASFVEIDNVRITSTYYTETDCSTTFDSVNGGGNYGVGSKCDVTANIYSSPTNSCTSSSDPGCSYRIHTEIDHDWQGAGYCGPGTTCDPAQAQSQIIPQSTFIDVQGFVFWDPLHLADQWHSFSGWELHPLTAWRFHQSSSQPDFGISASPSTVSITQGSSGSSIISLTSLNGFSGTVSLSATVSPTGPTTSLSPASVSLAAGGTASSTLTIGTTTTTATGSYTVTVTGTSGSLSHSGVVFVQVTSPSSQGDFTISANPSSMSVPRTGSGTSTLMLTSLNGFAGSVTLSVAVSGPHIRTNVSPGTVTLSPGSSGTAVFTVNAGHKAQPGSYTVTVKGTSGTISHSVIINLTVT